MIYARQNDKGRLTQLIMAENLGGMSDAELLRAVAKLYANGGPVGDVVSARLLSIAAMCEATGRTCTMRQMSALEQILSMVEFRSWCVCSNCGLIAPCESRYCPNCGAKVVDE